MSAFGQSDRQTSSSRPARAAVGHREEAAVAGAHAHGVAAGRHVGALLLLFDRVLDRLLLLVRRHRLRLFVWPLLLPRSAAEQGLEDVARLLRLGGVDAIGIVAGDEIVAAAARAGLQIGEIGFHAGDLPLDLAALCRRIGAEEQELLIVAADLVGVGARPRELGALARRGPGRLRVRAAPGRSVDRRAQPRAILGRSLPGGHRARQKGQHADHSSHPRRPARAAPVLLARHTLVYR